MDIGVESNNIDYHLPDTLTQDQLTEVLKKRMILCSNADHCPLQKEKLIDLYKKFIVPLPQKTHNKRTKNKQKSREMLKYVKFISLRNTSSGPQPFCNPGPVHAFQVYARPEIAFYNHNEHEPTVYSYVTSCELVPINPWASTGLPPGGWRPLFYRTALKTFKPINDINLNKTIQGGNGEVGTSDEMEKPLTNIVRISRKNNERQSKPVKLKRKHSTTNKDEISSKKTNEQVSSESQDKAGT